MSEQKDQPVKAKRRRIGTRKIILLVMLAAIIIGGIFFFRVPQRLGILPTPAERLLSQTPDRAAAKALMAELTKAGVNTQGMQLYVLPYKDGGNLAVVTLDSAQGFSLSGGDQSQSILNNLKLLATSPTAQQLDVKRVAIDYHGKSGDSLVALTASTETISGFAKGTLTRAQLMEELEAKFNLPELIKEVQGGSR